MSIQAYQDSGSGRVGLFPNPIIAPRNPATTDRVSPSGAAYQVFQEWNNSLTDACFIYLGAGNWVEFSTIVGAVTGLTGNSGGEVFPLLGNINILGNAQTTVVGTANTLTLTTTAAGFPITPYVVGPVGQAGYQTVQAALNAANAAGGGAVWVQPGSYTENLTLFNNTQVIGAVGLGDTGAVVITGVHTPPTSGSFIFRNVKLASATHIFSSVAAGTAGLVCIDIAFQLTNGFVFNLPNWASPGYFEAFDIGELSTNNGVVNNTGGAGIFFFNATMGAGTGQTMVTSGSIRMDGVDLFAPVSFATGTTLTQLDRCTFTHNVTFANNSTGTCSSCTFSSGSDPAITMSSSGTVKIINSTVTSSNNPAITGAGAGTLTLSDVVFTSNTAIAATLTLGTADLISGSAYRTTPLATNVTLSGNTLSSTGSDTNISINITPKGTGSVIYSASRAAADLNYQATNSDNTSGSSAAGFQAAVGGGTAGDPYTLYTISGAQSWITGIDNSASDAYVIAASTALGTTNAASWSTAGALTNTGAITATAGAITATNGNLVLGTAGNKIVSTSVGASAAAGANSFGTVTLVNGTVTVATTAVTASSIIMLTRQSVGATGANDLGILSVGTIVAATSFDINAWTVTNATALQADDQSVIGWMIIN